MMRGSSFLLEKSVRNYQGLILEISEMDSRLWAIDVDTYHELNIDILLDCKRTIIDALGRENNPSDTLISKIMLGVFANVPAFDTYVKKSLDMTTFGRKNLRKIKQFYDANESSIDSFEIHTLDFLTSEETNILYSKAKLIDMCCFMDGLSKTQ